MKMDWWVIADTHLGHRLMEEKCGRPIDFEARTLDRLRQDVKPQDVLIHLGDVALYDPSYWHTSLRRAVSCKMWLVRGNHDRNSLSWYLSHGWDAVTDELRLRIFGRDVLFTHRPAPPGGYDLNVHGHQHNTRHHPEDPMHGSSILVCLEDHYGPVSLRKLVEGRPARRKLVAGHNMCTALTPVERVPELMPCNKDERR